MSSPREGIVLSPGFAACFVFKAAWATRPGAEPDGVGGELAYGLNRRFSRFSIEVFVRFDGLMGVDGRFL